MVEVHYNAKASEVVVYAAEELAAYLERMLDPALDLEISLDSDSSAFAADCNDSFRVRICVDGENGGAIVGSNDRSVLLAVYDYLQYLGCRFLMPVRTCEIIPRVGREHLAAVYEKQESYFHRGVCIEGADSFENIMDYIAWLPKAGFNSFFLQFKSPYAFLHRWYSHERNPYAGEEPYTQEDAQRDMVLFEQAAKKRGLLVHKAGHGWTGEVLGYQTVSWDTGAEPDEEQYRHRMAMIGGRRELFHGIPANTNLCYHNGDAVDAFAALVTKYARENPYMDYLHVWLADTHNNLCECEDCCKTTLSDQYVELLNEIDRRLTQEGLKTRIVFLLYQELLWPPEVSRLENPDRFVLMFAPISRTFEKSYELDGAQTALPEFHRNQVTLPVNLGENMAFLRAWQKIFTGSGFVYDYPLGRAHYGDFGYVHIARVLNADIRKLDEMGLDGYISCQELRAAFPNALPNYVMGHTLFQKNCPVEELIREYYRACYDADAKAVLDYLSRLSELSGCDYVNGKSARCDADIAARMEEAVRCCEAFAETVRRHQGEDGAWESIYWEVLEYHRNYVILFARTLKALAEGDQAQADQKWEILREYICKNEEKYQPYLDVYRVLEVTQNYTGLHRQKS